ncbi:YhdP family protein, partial [Citrobacter freundii]
MRCGKLALFQKGAADNVGTNANFPQRITVRTPSLSLGGQQWNNLSIVSEPASNGSIVQAQGREINATLAMRNNAPWLANIKYLYYNPSAAKASPTKAPLNSTPASPFSAVD